MWKEVLPFCLFNLAVSVVIFVLRDLSILNATFPRESGFTTLTTLLSFLVVARVSRSYDRMWEARSLLSTCMSEARALAKITATLSHNDEGKLADLWREKVRVALIDMVTNMKDLVTNESLTNFVLTGERYPKVDETTEEIIVEDVMKMKNNYNAASENNTDDDGSATAVQQPHRETVTDPFLLSAEFHLLINNHGEYLGRQMEIQREMLLHKMAISFAKNFYVLLQFASTPVPFPTTQMAQTILLIWMVMIPCVLFHYTETLSLVLDCGDDGDDCVYTLPNTTICSSSLTDFDRLDQCLGNLSDENDGCFCELDLNVVTGWVLIVASFFGTYGFWGLERVAEELDLPFGDDANDIEVEALSDVAIKNINGYLTYRFDREKRNQKARRDNTGMFISEISGTLAIGSHGRLTHLVSSPPELVESRRSAMPKLKDKKSVVQFADNIDTPMHQKD